MQIVELLRGSRGNSQAPKLVSCGSSGSYRLSLRAMYIQMRPLPRAKWRKEFFARASQGRWGLKEGVCLSVSLSLSLSVLSLPVQNMEHHRERQRLAQRRADMATECFDRPASAKICRFAGFPWAATRFGQAS